MEVDFVKILKEDEGFNEFAKNVSLEMFATFNPWLVSTIWALYQSGMEWQQASFVVKTIIRNAPGPEGSKK